MLEPNEHPNKLQEQALDQISEHSRFFIRDHRWSFDRRHHRAITRFRHFIDTGAKQKPTGLLRQGKVNVRRQV